MSGGTTTAIYLLLGLGVVAGLYYALTQLMARQRQLNAELTRLERLAAEVSMNAEAILEHVDERIDRLAEITAEVEAKAEATLSLIEAVQAGKAGEVSPAQAAPKPGEPEVRAIPAPAKKQAKPRKRQGAQTSPQAPTAEAPKAGSRPAKAKEPVKEAEEPAKDIPPASLQRYEETRSAVFALADQGKSPVEIAQALGVPRGEVQLMLNLRNRKVTA